MGGGGGGAQQAAADRANAQSAAQFAENQAFNEAQAIQAQDNFERNLGFQQSSAAASLGLQQQQINEAKAREELIRARIESSKAAIEEAFKGRDSIFETLQKDTFDLNKQALTDNKQDAERNLAFALSRAGRRFDSLEVDKSADITDRFNEGLVDAQSFAQSTANAGRAADSSLRQSLLGSAASGAFNGQELISGAGGALSAIAGQQATRGGAATDNTLFNDIPNSINQLSGLFANQAASRGGGFGPSSRSRSGSGRVSNTGV